MTDRIITFRSCFFGGFSGGIVFNCPSCLPSNSTSNEPGHFCGSERKFIPTDFEGIPEWCPLDKAT